MPTGTTANPESLSLYRGREGIETRRDNTIYDRRKTGRTNLSTVLSTMDHRRSFSYRMGVQYSTVQYSVSRQLVVVVVVVVVVVGGLD